MQEKLQLRHKELQEQTQQRPQRPSDQFFGVGPISNMTGDEYQRRMLEFAFERWIELHYGKKDDRGNDLGPYTVGELRESMHRGHPADQIVSQFLAETHDYFQFGEDVWLGMVLGGGHAAMTALTSAMLHPERAVYVDTPKPDSEAAKDSGAFRQSWAGQILERYERGGKPGNVHFAKEEGHIPTAEELQESGIKIFVGVGNETTGATSYSEQDIKNLLAWIDLDPENHHAIIDGTSLLGAMDWSEEVRKEAMAKINFFMPPQKVMDGVPGFGVFSATPQARKLIDEQAEHSPWFIPRESRIAVAKDGTRSVENGPFFNPEKIKMQGGIINTFSMVDIARSTFMLQRMRQIVGEVDELNKRSVDNRQVVREWVANQEHPLFSMKVEDEKHQSAAVMLLEVNDEDLAKLEPDEKKRQDLHDRIIVHARNLLGPEGITHPNRDHERGLDAARYCKPYPGCGGDFRAWIGGIRPEEDIAALLENIEYAYKRAKAVVLEEMLAEQGIRFEKVKDPTIRQRKDDQDKAYKVLIADPIGTRKIPGDSDDLVVDISEVKQHIEEKGGSFHNSVFKEGEELEPGIHYFYQPDLGPNGIQAESEKGYDACIVAATCVPEAAQFPEGGVRIGAGTGNMQSRSWGGPKGEGGQAPLMNTPTFNSEVTAQRIIAEMLSRDPGNVKVGALDGAVDDGFDTGRDLSRFPADRIKGKNITIFGFGNIGRMVAKYAKAMGMNVTIYARKHHKEDIEAPGYRFADNKVDAAKGADFLTSCVGLGPNNCNVGIIDKAVLDALNPHAVVVNFDRGEIIDIDALGAKLQDNERPLHHVSVDADKFEDLALGEKSGPLAPYLALREALGKKGQERMTCLPHVAADTCHSSRVTGAIQAVDQINGAIRFHEVVNQVGSQTPEHYENRGKKGVPGVTKVTSEYVIKIFDENPERALDIETRYQQQAAYIAAIRTASSAEVKQEIAEKYGPLFTRNMAAIRAFEDEHGLNQPFEQARG